MTPWNRGWRQAGALVCGLWLLGLAPSVLAQAASLEDRLRSELRAVSQELQTLRGQQARSQAERTEALQQRDAARHELEQLKAQLQRAQQNSEQLRRSATEQIAARNDQLTQFRGAYDELLTLARGKEAERAALEQTATTLQARLQQCTTANQALYQAGQDVLKAYEQVTVSDILRTRQPFAAAARVRFDEILQQHGDALHQGRFDPAMPLPSAEAPAGGADTPPAQP